MNRLVTIFGGSGFVGRYIARRFAKKGYRVRVAVRRPNEALFVRTYGRVGQVEPVQANIRDEASVARACEGADIVVNATGILDETKFQSFEDVHVIGAERIAQYSKVASAKTFVHISAIGADVDSDANYARTKGEGEKEVLRVRPDAIIVRPSVIFGAEDDFFNRFGKMMTLFPIVPVPASEAKLQPVYVDDVAAFIEKAVERAHSGIFELGGPRTYTLKEIMMFTSQATMRNRRLFSLPNFVTRMLAYLSAVVPILSFGLIKNPFMSIDQFKMLQVDNIVSNKSGFDTLGMQATALEPIVKKYLINYRSRGQFEEMRRQNIE